MSQINILILVDTEKLRETGKTGEILNPSEIITMYDDQENSIYNPVREGKEDLSEIGTYASSGDLLIWGILPTDYRSNLIPVFDEIVNTSGEPKSDKKMRPYRGYLFNNSLNKAIIYHKNKLACAALTDGLDPSEEYDQYSYKVSFKIGEDKYWWDPFIEVRGDVKP